MPDGDLKRFSGSRRAFITAVTAASYGRILGANDRIQIGFIGYGLINMRHVADFRKMSDVDCAALCDVYQPRLEAGLAACGPHAKGYTDFRKMYEDNNLQAVVVGTPDHWHALQTILACLCCSPHRSPRQTATSTCSGWSSSSRTCGAIPMR